MAPAALPVAEPVAEPKASLVEPSTSDRLADPDPLADTEFEADAVASESEALPVILADPE